MGDPKKNQAYSLRIGVIDVSNRPHFRTNPTIAAGDFKVSIDGGALANLATIPVVEPAGSSVIKISLSATEMNGDGISIVAKDVAGNEWDDAIIYISTTDTAAIVVVTSIVAAEVEIINLALSHIAHGVEINNLTTENTEEARTARRVYATARDVTLRAAPWPFATRFVTLALVANDPTTEWAYSYRYPTDCLYLRRILSGVRNDTRQSRVSYKITSDATGPLIYTDEQTAVIEYTVNADTPLTYPTDFSMAFSYYLAFLMAPRLTGGDQFKLGNRALEMYRLEVARAKANAWNEEQPDEEVQSEFIVGR